MTKRIEISNSDLERQENPFEPFSQRPKENYGPMSGQNTKDELIDSFKNSSSFSSPSSPPPSANSNHNSPCSSLIPQPFTSNISHNSRTLSPPISPQMLPQSEGSLGSPNYHTQELPVESTISLNSKQLKPRVLHIDHHSSQESSSRSSNELPRKPYSVSSYFNEEENSCYNNNGHQRHHIRRPSVAIKFSPIYESNFPYADLKSDSYYKPRGKSLPSPVAECIFKGEF